MSCAQVEAWICRRLEAVRLMKNISQSALAAQAGVSRPTISRMENGKGVTFETLIRVMRSLGLADQLENLVPSVGIRPIDRIRQKGERKNASSPRKQAVDEESNWEWGETP